MNNIKLICGSSHPNLANKISNHLGIPLCECTLDKFSNSELKVEIKENIRNTEVFIIQTGCDSATHSINDIIIETLIMIDACKRSMAKTITIVMPYFPYSTQDKKDEARAPISAKMMANIFERVGIDRLVVMDLHASQIQGFFDIPVDNIYSLFLVNEYVKSMENKDIILASPDAGAIKRTLKFAKIMKLPTIFLHKQRSYEKMNTIDNMMIVGDIESIKDKHVIILDDMCDTGGTLIKCAKLLKENGAKEISCIVTHGILSGPAISRLNKTEYIKEMIVSNTLPQKINLMRCSKLKIFDVSELLGDIITKIITGDSISKLFEFK